ncbi:MAG: RsmG family class I SAM-dependent methyltransferase, partial [Bdellovibrionota bacterium]
MSKDPSENWRKVEASAAPSTDSVFEFGVSVARFKKWFPDLDSGALERVATYSQELLRFNKTINLISATTIKNADAVHFADCVSACLVVEKHMVTNAPLYDFGSGSGLPGLVFAILFPKHKVVLVDRDQRKLEFCKHVVGTL